MTQTVEVDAEALGEVLQALVGPGHLIRELQVIRGLPAGDDPLTTLIDQYNEQIKPRSTTSGN
jgi:hypothetical protein